MPQIPSRRTFLKNAVVSPLGLAAGASVFGPSLSAAPTSAAPPVGGSSLKLSLNAFSFNDALQDHLQGRSGGLSLYSLLEFCAEHDFDAIDPTGYYFPGYPEVPETGFINELKRRCHRLGLEISGTGIRNDFANPDAAARAADVDRAKAWIEAAARMGAPVIRLFAGHVPPGYEERWDDAAEWVIESFRACVDHGKKHGVLIGMQNHGEMVRNAEQTLHIVEQVDSEWFGVIVDTGNMKTADPYEDLARVMHCAVNWQVKESAFGNNSDIPIDLDRLFSDIVASGYRGYVPIETLKAEHRPYDPFVLVPKFAKNVRKAMQAALS